MDNWAASWVYCVQGHVADLVLALDRDHRDEAGEEAHGRDHRAADGDPLGLGLGGVAHRVEVGQDLAGALVVLLAHLLAVVAHLADAVGVVGHRAEDVHADRVAGQGQHADAAHRHAVGHEDRRGSAVDHDREQDRHGDDERRHHGRLVADGEPLDDVGRMAGLAALGQRLDRFVLGVGVVAGHLVERDGQDDADQAGPGRTHVQPRDAEVGPDRQAREQVPPGSP